MNRTLDVGGPGWDGVVKAWPADEKEGPHRAA
jgi:hypothetical protein